MGILSFSEAKRRLGPIAGVIAAQGITSALSLVTGLWVVRSLSTGQYALYTLAASVLGVMVLLADAGISAGTLSQAGRVWRDPVALAEVIYTALGLRRRFAWVVAFFALPILAVLLYRSGASWGEAILWVTMVTFVFIAGLGQLIWEIPLRVHEVLQVTQRTSVVQALLRALLTLAAVAVWPLGLLALAATGIAQGWASWRLKRSGEALLGGGAVGWSDDGRKAVDGGAEMADGKQRVTRAELRASILAVVRRSLPPAIYYVFTQQLGLWLLSLVGTTVAVAQFGALSRIAVILGVLSAVNHAVFAPRFSRVADIAKLPRLYGRQLGIILLLCVPLNGLAWLAPDALISLLGDTYGGLDFELRLAVLMATLQVIGGAAFHLGYARGWVMPPVATITSLMAVQVACVVGLNLATLRGALLMGLALALHQMITSITYCVYRMRRELRV